MSVLIQVFRSKIQNISGRQYNKDGDLQQWWDQKIIDNFKEKAQCIVDQYGSFYVPEANMTVSFIKTQHENIVKGDQCKSGLV